MTRRELFWGWMRGIVFFAGFCVVITAIMTAGIYGYYKPALSIRPLCAERRCVTIVTEKPAGFDTPKEYHVVLREMRGPIGQFLVWDAAQDPLPEPRLEFGRILPLVFWAPGGVLHLDFAGPEPRRVGTVPADWTLLYSTGLYSTGETKRP